MNSKQRKTLALIFKKPTLRNIHWKDVESLFNSLGAEVNEARGSRVNVGLCGVYKVFHRPHPQKEIGPKEVESIREFMDKSGVCDDYEI